MRTPRMLAWKKNLSVRNARVWSRISRACGDHAPWNARGLNTCPAC